MFSPVRWELRCSGMGKTVAGHGRRPELAIVGHSTDSMLHLSDRIYFSVFVRLILVLHPGFMLGCLFFFFKRKDLFNWC